MAQKQVIWSGHAKKKLYAVLEILIRENNEEKEKAAIFFGEFLKKLKKLIKSPGTLLQTSAKDVYAFYVDEYLVLFEIRESGLIIHSITGK